MAIGAFSWIPLLVRLGNKLRLNAKQGGWSTCVWEENLSNWFWLCANSDKKSLHKFSRQSSTPTPYACCFENAGSRADDGSRTLGDVWNNLCIRNRVKRFDDEGMVFFRIERDFKKKIDLSNPKSFASTWRRALLFYLLFGLLCFLFLYIFLASDDDVIWLLILSLVRDCHSI